MEKIVDKINDNIDKVNDIVKEEKVEKFSYDADAIENFENTELIDNEEVYNN